MTHTLRHTPLLKGAGLSTFLLFFSLFIENCKTGDFDFFFLAFLQFLINWLIVGIIYILRIN